MRPPASFRPASSSHASPADVPWNHASRRVALASLLGALSTLQSRPLLAATEVSSGVITYKIASAALDRRSYRGLLLPNGLRVLLASDPIAVKGAASMDVQVGYMSDPVELPGLAHFCEHMLFLGTRPFPDEGAFERLVGAAGGSNNAFTAAEETNYFFDVQGTALPAAVERFASFFTAPLFTPSATAREVNAIESEHSKNIQSDFWRYEQLVKLRVDPAHPYAKFGTGNRQTLRDGNGEARQALLEFHERYYVAEEMSLALIGPQSLDQLQGLAIKTLSSVPTARKARPSASAAYDTLPLPFRPAAQPPIATLMVPVGETRSLRFLWCVPVTDLELWIQSKPEEIWSLLVRNRGDGGLMPLLKRRGLANSLDAYSEEFTRSFLLLSVSVDLTPKGLSEWRTVAGLLFAYLRRLASAGVPAHVVDEFRQMAQIGFEYAEPGSSEDWATSASGNLPFYPPEQWVTGPSSVGPGSQSGVSEMLSWAAEPRNALITLVAKAVEKQATSTEPIYGTRYGTIPLEREMSAWSSSVAPAGLAPPQPNPYLPADLSIRCLRAPSGAAEGPAACLSPTPSQVAPTVIASRPGVTLHFLQDATFRRPKAYAFFLFRTPYFASSPRMAITSQLFQSMFADTLVDSTYQAGLAGLGAGIGAEFSGFSLTASGYNDRLPDLIRYVGRQVKEAELSSLTFDRTREALRQQLANFKLKQPVQLASYQRALSIESPKYSVEQLSAAVDQVSLADVRALQRTLLPEALLEAFVIGNVEQPEARQLTRDLLAAMPTAGALAPSQIARRSVRMLPAGRIVRQYPVLNPEEANSATEVYLQVGPDVGDDWIHLAVLAQLIEQPLYEELRTRQQLGYIVQSAITDTEGVRGLIVSVQSAVLPPPQVEERIDRFLTDFRATVAKLGNAELDTYLSALAAQATDVDQRLSSQASRLWSEMVMRRYDYGRPWRSARRFRGVTRAGLLEFYDRAIAPGAVTVRRMSTHVFSRRAAPSTLRVDPIADEFFPPPMDGYANRFASADEIAL